MKVKYMFPALTLFQLLFLPSYAFAQQIVTLHAPRDTESNRYDESRSWFSFDVGLPNDARPVNLVENGDLGYGFLAIGGADFFSINHGEWDRCVIKDLGGHAWTDSFGVPELELLPALREGERRQITVDSSAETGAAWERETRVFARAVVGHIYVARIEKGDTDLYALFRVEELEQGKRCTITWVALPGVG